jgi:hypothetical protein
MDRLLNVQRSAATALDSVQISHCDYADDIYCRRHMPVEEAVFYHCPKPLRARFLTIALSIGARLTVHILVSKPK